MGAAARGAHAGAIFVPLNLRLTAPELEFMLADSGARVVIAGREHRALIGAGPARLSAAEAAEGCLRWRSTSRPPCRSRASPRTTRR